MTDLDLIHQKGVDRWYPLIDHEVQTALVNDCVRFKVVPAGRRSGKTERAKRFIVREAFRDPMPYFIAAPTRDQVKRIYWQDLKQLCFTSAFGDRSVSESELQIRLPNGATINLIGLDQPQRIEGMFWGGGVVDEVADVHPTAWPENIGPALDTFNPLRPDYRPWCWLIGVPGGRNHYYDLAEYARTSGDPDWKLYTWKSADILPADVIEAAKRRMSIRQYLQEYEASFTNFEGRAYYAFDPSFHVSPLTYDPVRLISFCFDFNVDPGVCVVVQEQQLPSGEWGTGVIGEVHIERNSNTPAVCRKLIADWGEHRGKITCYGDATGGSRGSAKVQGSDWDLIKATLNPHFGSGRISYNVPNANPAEKVRINAVNSRLMSASGNIQLIVDGQKAPNMVKDLDGVVLLKGGSGELDKKATPALTHISDALGYYVAKDFPIVPQVMQRIGTVGT